MGKKEVKSIFIRTFYFVTEYFNINAEELSNCGIFSPTSVSSWRTRNAPSRESFDYLLDAIEIYLNKKMVNDFYDKNDFVKAIRKEVTEYSKLSILDKIDEYSLVEVVKITLNFAYSHKNNASQSNFKELKPNSSKREFKTTKAVVFDYDGTLTVSNDAKTTWQSLWKLLGYSKQECAELHDRFCRGDITHEEWCLLTEEKFKERKLNKSQVMEIVNNIELIPGIEEVFKELDNRNIKIYIISGSIKFIIRKTFADLYQYISGGINANEFLFDEEGYLYRIIGTKYDFEDKAKRINEIVEDLKISPDEVLFVGNSYNDEWAHKSGARTLAINPKDTNVYINRVVWNDYISECESLTEILKYI